MIDPLKIKKCTLKEALNYENEDVVFRFIKIYNVSEEEANRLFNETKKWLWLCYKSIINKKNKNQLLIDDSLLIIDEMWHNFILFTKDYEDYCIQKFGFFIHHVPTKKSEMLSWKLNVKESIDDYISKLKIQYSLVYDLLGEETLSIWYKEFPIIYSKEALKKILR